jgi:hypothetical protein
MPSEVADASVRPLRGVPSKKPPASVVERDEIATQAAPAAPPRRTALVLVAVAVVLWILVLIWLRLSGQG